MRGWLRLLLLLAGRFLRPVSTPGRSSTSAWASSRCIIVWGPLMIGGGYFVITGQWDWNVVLASLPYALGATTVIFGKHIDKLEADKAKGIHTLPVHDRRESRADQRAWS